MIQRLAAGTIILAHSGVSSCLDKFTRSSRSNPFKFWESYRLDRVYVAETTKHDISCHTISLSCMTIKETK
ncbi:hypothetical protein F5050DRAFT_1732541 [Lentinula boryana]|uniref:Secreted protein n=1 Tax=Lentinula boryana TaxID=40481 RepID=A0ABQ8QPB5_9AGAR|nr:hypothetical protein F5050DRAFT_1732541 [Lentinula boryana]